MKKKRKKRRNIKKKKRIIKTYIKSFEWTKQIHYLFIIM